MTEDSELPHDAIRAPSLFTRVLLRLAFVLALSAFLPALPWDASAQPANKPETLLGQGWQWLGKNKDQLSAVSAIFAGGSLIVAAFAFIRAQRINNANTFYQILKDVRDLRLQEAPIKPSDRNSNPLLVGLNFYASIDQYRITGLIDKQTWKNFERDLQELVKEQLIQDWLDQKPSACHVLPSVTAYDSCFVAYLRKLRSNKK